MCQTIQKYRYFGSLIIISKKIHLKYWQIRVNGGEIHQMNKNNIDKMLLSLM